MAIRDGLLALLRLGPRHGYQLKSEFESATGRVWPLNVGQVYTTLDRLQRDGLVDSAERDGGQREYRLTTDGRDALEEWWESSTADTPPPRDELMLKVLIAIDVDSKAALEVITSERTALFERLQQHRRAQRATTKRGSLAEVLALDALVTRMEADLRWLDMCEQRVQAKGNGS
jgi:DNA-binding PadR family transcriptional regulator